MYDYTQENRDEKSGNLTSPDIANEVAAWRDRAEELAAWVEARMLVRNDAYGKYYVTWNGDHRRCKEVGLVDHNRILIHFAANNSEKLIGLFTTSKDDTCLWLGIDFDRHDGDPDELATTISEFSEHVFEQVRKLGFHPLLIDSNGRGGRHLLVLFDRHVSAKVTRAFGLWLVREWERLGMPHMPEVFPKQDSIGGKYGNFLRLFGLHHSRNFWSKVWDGQHWQAGHAAIDIIVSKYGDSPDLVPADVRTLAVTPKSTPTPLVQAQEKLLSLSDQWWTQYRGNLRTLDIVGLFESYGYEAQYVSDREFEVECPWAEEHTTGEDIARLLLAAEDEDLFPAFHCFHNHCQHRGLKEVLAHFGKEAVEQYCGEMYGEAKIVINPKDPLGTARKFAAEVFRSRGVSTLVHHKRQWYRWDGQRYVEAADDDLRAKTWNWLGTCHHQLKSEQVDPYAPPRGVVTSVVDALKATVNLASNVEAPCWISDDVEWGDNIVAFQNGLLDVERFIVLGESFLIPHTPKWFSTNCLPHKFDSTAQCPRWLEFLNQVFEGDSDQISALAQWFGYCLTSDTRQQKLAMLVGPPRSGKGTTMAVLSHILGSHNVANPSLTSLGTRFGLESLVGKQAAIIGDGHLGRQSDAVAILERLKSIVGGDPQNIDRKGRPEMTNVTIPARFTISVNELPRLPDASAALRSRTLLIPFNLSFEGREDINLLERLLKEIPGITNWALDGLWELRQKGRLTQPKAGQEILDDFVRYSSPVQAFLEDCCSVGAGEELPAHELQAAWRLWCQDNGHEVGSFSTFATRLRAAVSGIKRVRRRVEGGKQEYHYQGLRLDEEMLHRVRSLC